MLFGAMGACSNCGVMLQPGDRFCNGCGTSVGGTAMPGAPPRYAPVPAAPQGYPAEAPSAPHAPAPYPAQPAQPPPYVPPAAAPAGYAPPPQPQTIARCQLGHEIVRGTSYCALGHPIALDQMQFANDTYGASFPAPVYAAPAQPPQYAPHVQRPDPQQRIAATAPAPQGYAPPQPVPPAQAMAPRADPSRDAAAQKVLRGFVVAYGRNPNGDFWPLTGGRHTIGRLGSSDGIEIPIQDPTVSSRHATLIVDPATGSIVVEDAGSTNGTFVNDEPIGRAGWRELRDGDRLRVGGFTTVVKVIGPI
jgi:pSer/pThr/pTyr-binding forkhead associated (FHA) protein